MSRTAVMARHRSARSPARCFQRAALALCFALLGATLACGPSAEQREARRVVAQIDRLRSATPEQREPLLDALERQGLAGAASKEARRRCAGAYRALLEASRLESRAREQLAYPSPPPSALHDLASAEAKVKQATAEMPRCNEALAALRRLARR